MDERIRSWSSGAGVCRASASMITWAPARTCPCRFVAPRQNATPSAPTGARSRPPRHPGKKGCVTATTGRPRVSVASWSDHDERSARCGREVRLPAARSGRAAAASTSPMRRPFRSTPRQNGSHRDASAADDDQCATRRQAELLLDPRTRLARPPASAPMTIRGDHGRVERQHPHDAPHARRRGGAARRGAQPARASCRRARRTSAAGAGACDRRRRRPGRRRG